MKSQEETSVWEEKEEEKSNDDAPHTMLLNGLAESGSNGSSSRVDILLIAQDGDCIPASRFVLAIRSPILLKKLYMSNEQCTQVEIDSYSGATVRALVEHCKTNDIEEFMNEIGLSEDEPETSEFAFERHVRIREMIQLCHLARTLQVEGLEERACELSALLLEHDMRLACALYDEALGLFGNEPELQPVDGVCILAMALDAIRTNPEACLLNIPHMDDNNSAEEPLLTLPGVTYLGVDALRELLCDDHVDCDEIVLFGAVHVWSETTDGLMPSGRIADREVEEQQHNSNGSLAVNPRLLMCKCAVPRAHSEKRTIAKTLVSDHIDLSCMVPSDLMGPVLSSGLVKKETVFETLEKMTSVTQGRSSRQRRSGRVDGVNKHSSRLAMVNCFAASNSQSKLVVNDNGTRELLGPENPLSLDDGNPAEESLMLILEQDEQDVNCSEDDEDDKEEKIDGNGVGLRRSSSNLSVRLLKSLRCTVPGQLGKKKKSPTKYEQVNRYISGGSMSRSGHERSIRTSSTQMLSESPGNDAISGGATSGLDFISQEGFLSPKEAPPSPLNTTSLSSSETELGQRNSLRSERSIVDDLSTASESSQKKDVEASVFGMLFAAPTSSTAPRAIRKTVNPTRRSSNKEEGEVMVPQWEYPSFANKGCHAMNIFG